MSIAIDRKSLLKQLNEHVQDNGNTNILLVNAIAQNIGLSATEFECCDLIQKKGPCTVGQLAKWCRITTGGMTGMLDRLEHAEFVKRLADPKDRRRVLVTAVDNKEASSKVRKLYGPLQQDFDTLLAQYSDEELAFIVHFMGRINGILHKTIDTLPEK